MWSHIYSERIRGEKPPDNKRFREQTRTKDEQKWKCIFEILTNTQIYWLEANILQDICVYSATCEDELNWHMLNAHDNAKEYFIGKAFFCDACSRCFVIENELFVQKKEFQEFQSSTTVFSCNFCEENVTCRRDLITHKKLNTVKKYLFVDYLLQDHFILLDIIASFSVVKQHVKESVLAMNANFVK